MLKLLSIQNIVLIDNALIEFGNNHDKSLCIFTGETGSGKSLLLNAIGLIAGKRPSNKYISDPAKKAVICADFDISNNTLCKNLLIANDLLSSDNENIISIRRVINKNSSNKIFINDQVVGTSLHQIIAQSLVEIHGQFETSALLNQSNHINLLDQYAKNGDLLSEINDIFQDLQNSKKSLKDYEGKKQQYIREKDYLLFVIEELKALDIKDNEEEELLDKKRSLKNKSLTQDFLNNLRNSLFSSRDHIYNSQNIIIKNNSLLESISKGDQEKIEFIGNFIDDFSVKVDNSIDDVNGAINNIDNNDCLEDIDERLFEIKNLSRKFNTSSENLHKIAQESQQKLEALDNQDTEIIKLQEKINNLEFVYNKLAKDLHKKRLYCAKSLSKKTESELSFLNMGTVNFQIAINHVKEQFSHNGKDKVKFLIATNNSKQFDEINKIASGGELSRFMLALKISLMDVKSTPTMIFDEIDTGIGGNTSYAVGSRLLQLAQQYQIFVVTHQPQIAAMSNIHFCIKKEKDRNKIKTTIEKLEKNCQYKEVARMISGKDITEESIAAAKKLFN